MTLPGDGTTPDPYAQPPGSGAETSGVPVPPADYGIPQATHGGIETSAYGEPYGQPSADPYGPSAHAPGYGASADPYGAPAQSYGAHPVPIASEGYFYAQYAQPGSPDGYAAPQYHSYAQHHPYTPYQAYPQQPSGKLSLTGMLLSIGGVVGIVLPVLGYFSWAAAIAGIILGFVAKGKEPEQKGMWLTAIIVGFAYFPVSVIVLVFTVLLLSARL